MMLHAILVETHANADLLEKVIRKTIISSFM